MALSAVPGIGTFAYLAAKPVRRNRLLLRASFDVLLRKVPGRLYERSGLQRWVARPVFDRVSRRAAGSQPRGGSSVYPDARDGCVQQ
jgi:hypothetical protein